MHALQRVRQVLRARLLPLRAAVLELRLVAARSLALWLPLGAAVRLLPLGAARRVGLRRLVLATPKHLPWACTSCFSMRPVTPRRALRSSRGRPAIIRP